MTQGTFDQTTTSGLSDVMAGRRGRHGVDGSSRPHGSVPSSTIDFPLALIQAAETILYDPVYLDPRWRDPLSPAKERHTAVIKALNRAFTEAQQGTIASSMNGISHLPDTTEATLLRLYNETLGWKTIQPYFDDPKVNEIKFIGTRVQIAYTGAQSTYLDSPFSITQLDNRARVIAEHMGQPLNEAQPTLSVALGFGTRFTCVVRPRAVQPLLVFRRGRSTSWSLDDLIRVGTLNESLANLLRFLLRLRCSMLVVGATGSGKTAFLECVLDGTPGHVITLEDGAQEILLKPAKAWTAEVVDVLANSNALREAMRTMLRVTPDVIAIGECRSGEAAEIIALGMTDHQMLTTLHADSASGALRRMGTLASMPGTSYSGRFDDALLDATQAINVVVVVQYWGHIGRRVVTEVGFSVGVRRDPTSNALYPQVVRLAEIETSPDGDVDWKVYAMPNSAGNGLTFVDGSEPLSEESSHRLRQNAYRVWSAGMNQTPVERMQNAVKRALTALEQGQSSRVVAELLNAWTIQRSEADILPVAEQYRSRMPHHYTQEFADQFQTYRGLIDAALRQQQWDTAQHALDQVFAHPLFVIGLRMDEWATVREQIDQGLQAWNSADAVFKVLEERIQRAMIRETLDEISRMPTMLLDQSRKRQRLEARVRLLTILVERGEAEVHALQTAQQQLSAYEETNR